LEEIKNRFLSLVRFYRLDVNTSSKLSLSLLFAVGVVALSSTVSANSITLEIIPGYQMGYGGEFLAIPDADLFYVLDSYSPKAKLNNGFFTFCLERVARITFEKPHNAVVNDVVVGVGGHTGGVHGVDAVSNGTAWLYQQFATGTLEGYDYTAGHRSMAGKLQTAIWWLEGEVFLARPKKNPFVRLAINHFDGKVSTLADNDGSFGVQVLNLGKSPQSSIQDMLVYSAPETPGSPVFDGGDTLFLLSASLLTLAVVQRKAHLASFRANASRG
jgi:hypothetical protein